MSDCGRAGPYPGLRSFQQQDAHLFFGREVAVARMLERLRRERFLAVTGPSGCGKSSLVRAGLLHELDLGGLGRANEDWRFVMFRPGGNPLDSLSRALAEAFDSELARFAQAPGDVDQALLIRAQIERSPTGLLDWLDSLELASERSVLLLADQFEEVFRYEAGTSSAPTEWRSEADRFIRALLSAGNSDVSQERDGKPSDSGVALADDSRVARRRITVFVVLTIRLDFLGDCAQFEGLAEAISDGQFLVPRLSRAEVERAISEPAKVCGGEVEDRLIAELANDIAADLEAGSGASQAAPDMLPLMQHMLSRLWEATTAKLAGNVPVLTLEQYHDIGGLTGALSSHLDSLFAELSPELQLCAERLFKALSHTSAGGRGRDVRRPITLREARQAVGMPEDVLQAVISTFSGEGKSFLVLDGPMDDECTVLDISHEALIRQWQRLQLWVREEEADSKEYSVLERQALAWEAGRGELLTSRGAESARKWWSRRPNTAEWARRYGHAPEVVARYIEESQARRTKRKIALTALGCLLGAIIITIAGAVLYAATQRLHARQSQLEEAYLQANLAQAKLEAGDAPLAAALMREYLPPAAGGLRSDRPYSAKADGVLYASLRHLSTARRVFDARASVIATDAEDWIAVIMPGDTPTGSTLSWLHKDQLLDKSTVPDGAEEGAVLLTWKQRGAESTPVPWMVAAGPRRILLATPSQRLVAELPPDIEKVAAIAIEKSTGVLALIVRRKSHASQVGGAGAARAHALGRAEERFPKRSHHPRQGHTVQPAQATDVALLLDISPLLDKYSNSSERSTRPDTRPTEIPVSILPFATELLGPGCREDLEVPDCDDPRSTVLTRSSDELKFIYPWRDTIRIKSFTRGKDSWLVGNQSVNLRHTGGTSEIWSDGDWLVAGQDDGDLYGWNLKSDVSKAKWRLDLGNDRLGLMPGLAPGTVDVVSYAARSLCIRTVRLTEGAGGAPRCVSEITDKDAVAAATGADGISRRRFVVSTKDGVWMLDPDQQRSESIFATEAAAREDAPKAHRSTIVTTEKAAVSESASVKIWDAEKSQVLAGLALGIVPSVPILYFSMTGRQVFLSYGSSNATTSRWYCLDTHSQRKAPMGDAQPSVDWVVFSDDGSRLYAIGEHALSAWTCSGRRLWTRSMDSEEIFAVGEHFLVTAEAVVIDQVDGKLIESPSPVAKLVYQSGSVAICRTTDGRLLKLNGRTGKWEAISPSTDDDDALPQTVSSDDAGQVIAVITKAGRLQLLGAPGTLSDATGYKGADVAPNGSAVLAYQEHGVALFNISPDAVRTHAWSLEPGEPPIQKALFSPQGDSIIVLQPDRVSRRTMDGTAIYKLAIRTCDAVDARAIPLSSRIAVRCDDLTTVLETQPELHVVTTLWLSARAPQTMIAASAAYRIDQYWMQDGDNHIRIADDQFCCGDPSAFWRIYSSPTADWTRTLLWSKLGSSLLWDSITNNFRWQEKDPDPVLSASVNQKYVVTLHEGGRLSIREQGKVRTIRVFPSANLTDFAYTDPEALMIRDECRLQMLHLSTSQLTDLTGPSERCVVHVSTSMDGRLVGLIRTDGTAEVRAVSDLHVLHSSPGAILSASQYLFDEEGRRFVHPLSDDRLEIVSLFDADQPINLTVGADFVDARLSPNGKYVAVAYQGGQLKLWHLASGVAVAEGATVGQHAEVFWYGDNGLGVVTNDGIYRFVFPTLHFRSHSDVVFLGDKPQKTIDLLKPRELTPDERELYLPRP